MDGDLVFGTLRVDPNALTSHAYHCDPARCRDRFCCARFDVALTQEEAARIEALLPALLPYCPWLEGDGHLVDPFHPTPCEIILRKRPDGTCILNHPAEDGRLYCAIHTWALAHDKNPFAAKPLPCSLWPFVRDGADRCTLDLESAPPCLTPKSDPEPDPELVALLAAIPSELPTELPTEVPTELPTEVPTEHRFHEPSELPTKLPTKHPIEHPIEHPTLESSDTL